MDKRKFYQGETAWFVIIPRGGMTETHSLEARVVDRAGEVVIAFSSEAEEDELKIRKLTEGKWGFRLSPTLTASLLGEYRIECWSLCADSAYLLSRQRFRVRRSTRGEGSVDNF